MPQAMGVSRLRLSPGEVERLIKEDMESRRRLRIIQVREKAKVIAKDKLKSVRDEKVRQLELLAERIQQEWEANKQTRITELESEYADSLRTVGSAHSNAEQFNDGQAQRQAAVLENKRRAQQRHKLALQKLAAQRWDEENRSQQQLLARQMIQAKEKIRSQQIASLPVPLSAGLQKLLTRARHAYIETSNMGLYSHPCEIPDDVCMVQRHDPNETNLAVNNAVEQQDVDAERAQNDTCQYSERLAKARVRGDQALKRERMRLEYDNMMRELENLERADRRHRQQMLEHIPQSIFLPAHVVQERSEDRQVQMERDVERLFASQHDDDHLDIRTAAQPLNYDTTPTVTETTIDSTPSSDVHPPTRPIGKQPFRNVTNLTPSDVETTPSTSGTSGSTPDTDPDRKRVLNKMMKRIRNQREEWMNAEIVDSSQTPAHSPDCSPQRRVDGSPDRSLEAAREKSRVQLNTNNLALGCRAERDKELDLTVVPEEAASQQGETISDEPMSQHPDKSSTDASLSQHKLSDGDTTSSSQFIERQRKDLFGYMKSLENQIGELESIRQERVDIERMEREAERLETKLVTGDWASSTEPSSTESFEQPSTRIAQFDSELKKLKEQQKSLTAKLEAAKAADVQKVMDSAGSLDDDPTQTTVPADIDASLLRGGKTDESMRRPNESFTEWYLRYKRHHLREEANQKLESLRSIPKVALSEPPTRGYELVTPRGVVDDQRRLQTAERRGPVGEPIPNYSQLDRPMTAPPVGYVSVEERERLARGDLTSPSAASPLPPLSNHMLSQRSSTNQLSDEMTYQTASEDAGFGFKIPTELDVVPHGRTQMDPTFPSTPPLEVTTPPRELTTRATARSQPNFISVTERENLIRSITPESSKVHLPPSVMVSHDPDIISISRDHEVMSSVAKETNVGTSSMVAPPWAAPSKAGSGSYMSVEERQNLLRNLTQKIISTPISGHRYEARYDPTPTELPLMSNTQSWKESYPRDKSGNSTSGAATITARGNEQPTRASQRADERKESVDDLGTYRPSAEDQWSALQRDMLERQRAFNSRQEELRQQLADIQQQKTRLLESGLSSDEPWQADDQSFHHTESNLMEIFHRLGISVDASSTPDRSAYPPPTRPGALSDLQPHELSAIPEVDTPTHLTEMEETLQMSLPGAGESRTTSDTGTSFGSSAEPAVRSLNIPSISITADNDDPTEQDDVPSNVAQLTSQTDTHTTKSSQQAVYDPKERSAVLHDLLAGLEARRLERQRMLNEDVLKESSDAMHSSAPLKASSSSSTERPGSSGLQGSSSYSPAYLPAVKSSSDSPSVPSPSVLTQQLKDITNKWLGERIPFDETTPGVFGSSSSDEPPRLHGLSAEGRDEEYGSGVHDLADDTEAHTVQAESGDSSVSQSPGRWRESSHGDAASRRGWTHTLDKGEGSLAGISEPTGETTSCSDTKHTISTSDERSYADSEFMSLSQAPLSEPQTSDQSSRLAYPHHTSGSTNYSSEQHSSIAHSVVADDDLTTPYVSVLADPMPRCSSPSISDEVSPAQSEGCISPAFITPGHRDLRPASSTPLKSRLCNPTVEASDLTEYSGSGILDEKEITFASTVADVTLTRDDPTPSQSVQSSPVKSWSPVKPAGSLRTSSTSLQPVDEQETAPTSSHPVATWDRDVRSKVRTERSAGRVTSSVGRTVDVDKESRKKKQKEMTERTKRLYSQLEEVKIQKKVRGQEKEKANVQARRKEYAEKLKSKRK